MSDLEEQRRRARAAREALVGTTVAGRYVLHALIGHGGMGAVYEAEHAGIGKRVAVKLIDPEFATDERVVARFAREARAMSAIESAHIVTVFDAGTDDGKPFLVMELLRGEDLGERLRRTRTVPVAEALHIVAQVLKGLGRAHAAGIVHRDLKPDNVFVTRHDLDPVFAKIVDFGISKIERPRQNTSPLALTGRGTVLGTPFYMSPEQAQCSADVDGRADLYSVGAILFECLTGRPPHTGESYEQVILSICMRDAPDIRVLEPSLSPELAAFVARALSRDKVQRFPSAERMLAALHEIAPQEKTRVPLDPPPAQTLLSPGGAPKEAGTDRHPISAKTRLGIASLGDGFGERIPDAPERAASDPPASPRLPANVRASDPSAPVRPSAPTSADTPTSRDVPEKKRPRRSWTAAIVTAVLALFTGIGVTVAAISAIHRGPAVSNDPVPPQPSPTKADEPPVPPASASVGPATLTSATAVEPADSSQAPQPAAASASAVKPVVRPVVTKPSPSATNKGLDIQRDLP